MFDISASLVLYNTNISLLNSVLESFLNNHKLKVKLYIIDNSPVLNHEYLELISKYSFCEYLYNSMNIGYGSANNLAIKSRKEVFKYHLILNPDIYFDGSILEEIVKYMDCNLSVGLLMPKILNTDNSIQYLCKMLPTPKVWLIRAFFSKSWIAKKINYNFEYRFCDYDKIIRVPYLSGCFMFIRNSVFNDVGLFDENIFLHTEDVDFSRRIYEKYDNIFYPFVSVQHGFNRETYKSLKVFIYHIKSTIYYFNKWGWFFDYSRSKINNSILSEYVEKKSYNKYF